MDGEKLDFEEGVFDAAISRLGLMFFLTRDSATGTHRVESRRQRCRHVFSTAEESAFRS
jgi:hypothetical protein